MTLRFSQEDPVSPNKGARFEERTVLRKKIEGLAAVPQNEKEAASDDRQAALPRIDYEAYRLTNGLDVILHEDHKLPVVHVNLWYHVGSKNEEWGKTGFAHLFEHMMFEGSRHVTEEYVSLMERAGANISQGGVNGTTNFDRTNYFQTVPSGSMELVLWAESDRMAYLLDAVNQENLDNQRDVVKNERRQTMDNVPYGTAVELIFQNLFPSGHPYSWHIIGSMEDLGDASLDDIHAFFKKYYTPNNCTLTVAGDFDRDEAKRLVENYFGSISPGPALSRAQRWEIELDAPRRLVVHDRIPQDRLYLAWPAVSFFHDDDAALDLVSNILSDGKNSRLYKRLVYDEQVASDVSVFNYSLEIAGLVGVVATARPGVELSTLEGLIDEEIVRFAKDGPTPDELQRVKAGQEYDFVSGLERLGGFGGKADRLAMYNTYLGSPDHFLADYARYEKLTPGHLSAAATDYLLGPRLTMAFQQEHSEAPTVQEPDRASQPAIGPSKQFQVPEIEVRELENGTRLLVVSRRDIPKIGSVLLLPIGAIHESVDKAGLALMTAELLEEGTTTRSSLEIEAELDRMGSRLSAAGSREWSMVSMNCLKRHLPDSLDLMFDVALNPAFPEEELERARKQRLDGILQDRANPAAIAGRVLRRHLFGQTHPYGWPISGVESSIASLTRADLEGFYREFYRPQSSSVIMVGDVSLDEAAGLIESRSKEWRGASAPNPSIELAPSPKPQVFLADRPGAAQSELRLCMLGPGRDHEDYIVLDVLNTILGGGFSGRLNLNLREDKGYTYGAYSAIRYARYQSLLLASTPVESSVTVPAVQELFAEIDALHEWKKPVTEKELDDAKKGLTRGFAQRFETMSQLASEVAELQGFGLSMSELQAYTERIDGVTIESLEAASKRYFDSQRAILVVVGDASRVREDLSALDFGRTTIVDADGAEIS